MRSKWLWPRVSFPVQFNPVVESDMRESADGLPTCGGKEAILCNLNVPMGWERQWAAWDKSSRGGRQHLWRLGRCSGAVPSTQPILRESD